MNMIVDSYPSSNGGYLYPAASPQIIHNAIGSCHVQKRAVVHVHLCDFDKCVRGTDAQITLTGNHVPSFGEMHLRLPCPSLSLRNGVLQIARRNACSAIPPTQTNTCTCPCDQRRSPQGSRRGHCYGKRKKRSQESSGEGSLLTTRERRALNRGYWSVRLSELDCEPVEEARCQRGFSRRLGQAQMKVDGMGMRASVLVHAVSPNSLVILDVDGLFCSESRQSPRALLRERM